MHNAGVPPRLAKQHHLQHSIDYKGTIYYIPVYVDGPTTTIRIHDLSPQMPNTTISDYLQQYGKVISITNEVWKNYFAGLPNGVRVVRMRMEKPVPSHIKIDDQPSLVTYPNGEKPKPSPSVHEKEEEQKQRLEQTSNSAAVDLANGDDLGDDQQKLPIEIDDDDDDDNDNRETDELQTTTKRRLSTRTSSEDNDIEQTHVKNQEEQEGKERCESSDSGWRVTRSRKCKKTDKN